MSLPVIAHPMAHVAKRTGIARHVRRDIALTLQYDEIVRTWTLSIRQRGERTTQAIENEVREAFGVPDEALWDLHIFSTDASDKPLAQKPRKTVWYVIRLKWREPTQPRLIDTRTLDGGLAYYGVDDEAA